MVMEMSKTYQYRKVMKPLLERKRRARINKCLDDLKDLMVECLQQEGEHVTRLEKADILELTVEHMRKLKTQSNLISIKEKSKTHSESFRTGYIHAADQISQVLSQRPEADAVNEKVMKFLSARLLEMQNKISNPAPVITVKAKPVHVENTIQEVPPVNGIRTMMSHNPFVTINTEKNSYLSDMCSTSTHLSRCKYYTSIKDELIDVTSVEYNSESSVISIETNYIESVWRPW